ncbi:MAG TPA: thermonuclease family protein [Archangium sp.]|nr:thermonuclease family protein [Archangium sp.]
MNRYLKLAAMLVVAACDRSSIPVFSEALSSADTAAIMIQSVPPEVLQQKATSSSLRLIHEVVEEDLFVDDTYRWGEVMVFLGEEKGDLIFFTTRCAMDVGFDGNRFRYTDPFDAPEFIKDEVSFFDGEQLLATISLREQVGYRLRMDFEGVDFALIYVPGGSQLARALSHKPSLGLTRPTEVVGRIASLRSIFGIDFVLRSKQCDDVLLDAEERAIYRERVANQILVIGAALAGVSIATAVGISEHDIANILDVVAGVASDLRVPQESLSAGHLPGGGLASKPVGSAPVSLTITRVIDGDTLEADGRLLRLIGIDAPEMKTRDGKRLKKMLQELLESKRVMVTEHGEDPYGRTLANVFVPEMKMNLSDELLRRGLARPYLENRQILCQFPQFLQSALSAIAEERGFTGGFKKDAPGYEQSLRDAREQCVRH